MKAIPSLAVPAKPAQKVKKAEKVEKAEKLKPDAFARALPGTVAVPVQVEIAQPVIAKLAAPAPNLAKSEAVPFRRKAPVTVAPPIVATQSGLPASILSARTKETKEPKATPAPAA